MGAQQASLGENYDPLACVSPLSNNSPITPTSSTMAINASKSCGNNI